MGCDLFLFSVRLCWFVTLAICVWVVVLACSDFVDLN